MAQADTGVSKSKLQKSSTYKDFDFGKTWVISKKINDGCPALYSSIIISLTDIFLILRE